MTIDAKNDAADKPADLDTGAADDSGAEEINWQERAVQAEKALVKHKDIAKKAQDAAKLAKKGLSEDGQDYKKLYEQEGSKAAKLVERMKRADVTSAATAQLTKLGVTADGLAIAQKLLDISAVEWDEDDGADTTSVKAAVQSLRNEYPSLFEKKINGVKPANPAEGKNLGSQDNVMTREEFDKLPGKEKAVRIMKGLKLVD